MSLRFFQQCTLCVWFGIAWILPTSAINARIPGTYQSREMLSDTPFLQEVGRKIPTTEPLLTLVLDGAQLWAGTAGGLLRLEGDRFVVDSSLTGPVHRLVNAGGKIWAMTGTGLYRRDASMWTRISAEPVSDITRFRESWIASVGNRLWKVAGDQLELLTTNQARFAITRIVAHNGTLFVHGLGRLAPYATGRFGGIDAYTWPSDQAWDWGNLPSLVTREVLSTGSSLFVATDRGLGELRGMSLTPIRGEQGLPFEETLCLATGFTNDLWIGTTRGMIRRLGNQYQYFSGQRWLPSERVHAIVVGERIVYAATDRGLGVLDYVPYTLAKKAAYYERHLDDWGQRRLGFVHKLEWDAKQGGFVREVSDNDGGYSGNYLAAQCYRYAVTGDPVARREATNTFHALRWLEAMTGIPGFPARSVWAKGEIGHQADHGSGAYPAEWHDTADGLFEWKGDTSSDELCSQFYSFSLFLDLVATVPEKAQARAHLSRIAHHLIRNRWNLIDLDGKPTRWGRWDPDYFLTDEGRYDRGLQAVELLSFIKTAEVLTGEPTFAAAYQQLVDLGYPEYTLRTRNTFPPESILHFLDELSFWSHWNLLRFEQNPDRLAVYRRSYERSYEVVRVEENPWFNFLYGALTGNPCDTAASVEHLRSWPLDLRTWSYQNSHRSDLRTPAGHVALKGGTRTFSPRETEPLRWDHWLMQADGGSGGNDVVEPSGWLLAYWMGRHHGFIGAPTTDDPALLSGEPSRDREKGAKPYIGSSRPEGF